MTAQEPATPHYHCALDVFDSVIETHICVVAHYLDYGANCLTADKRKTQRFVVCRKNLCVGFARDHVVKSPGLILTTRPREQGERFGALPSRY